MNRVNRVLCPVDFSEFSKHALDHAAALARSYEAALIVLHVTPSDAEMAANELRAFTADTVEAGPRVQVIVRTGPPAPVILDCAREVEADLLVLGTHGRSGFERLMLGSVTEKVVLKAGVPVLTVPRAVRTTPEGDVFEHVLCAVDFSEASLRALRYALALVVDVGGYLDLLHVVEWMPEASLPIRPDFDVEPFRRSLVSEAKARLDALVPDEMKDRFDLHTRVRWGKPYQEIVAAAREESAELIVMGVQGRGPVNRMVFGSTTQHVVRKAECPVLTVRP